ncbi:hypothetical protein BG011_009044 [Mortierella polycephala]|uniref:Poly(A) RNA polymerase mitochondrial-like central palm domain-containing protein n=1 Tax=Mortierella polycephala TaxID=41804 RepID=A0A9P6PLW9_9FUNG|nr:hypothetical protein BG011_009044 [Mortierella polycephala]
MKVNRRHFVGILYDCILFEHASLVDSTGMYTLSLLDLADTFAFVADFYKHKRRFMDIPCDQFITRNQLHTVIGLVDYIETLDSGVFEIFPRSVELREEAPSFTSSSSVKRERWRQQRLGSHGPVENSAARASLDLFNQNGRSWTTDIYNYRGQGPGYDTDTDLDDEYLVTIPGLSKTDIQTFLWEYAYLPEDYQDDIATLIRYLRQDEWMMNGSKGSIIMFDWDMEGVQKFSKEYNQNKIHKIVLREQEEAKKAAEVAQKQQEEWNRQLELRREQEAAQRIKYTDEFIWKLYKSLSSSSEAIAETDSLIKTLEIEISEYFGFCFVTLTAVGSFATGLHTIFNDLDLTLTGNVKHITLQSLAEALRHFNYEDVSVNTNSSLESIPSIPAPLQPAFITFADSKTGTICHLALNDPIAIYRSKLVLTYSLIDPRFGPVMVALNHIAAQRHLLSGSAYQDTQGIVPLGGYAQALMLITFLQTENPPLLPKLQQTPLEGDDRPAKETIVQGIDCSFDRDWNHYQGIGTKNTKNAAELLIDFCRFFGYVFDYESKEVNARIGAFRWRPDLNRTTTGGSQESSKEKLDNVEAFYVMDPFMIGLNVTPACQGELVRVVKECFQEAYEALNEGDINQAFSKS